MPLGPIVRPTAARPSQTAGLMTMQNPLVMAILQAQQQQQQEQAAKAQVMQALGFGENPLPMGAIPRGHGISIMDGKAWTRPGGTPPGIQMLMEALLGVKSGGMHSRGSAGSLANTGVGLTPPQPQPNDDLSFVANRARTAFDTQDPMLLQSLLVNYPELMNALFPRQQIGMPQNSGRTQGAGY